MIHQRLLVSVGILASVLTALTQGCTEDSAAPSIDAGVDASLSDAPTGDATGSADAPLADTSAPDSNAPADGSTADASDASDASDAGVGDASPDVVLSGCDLGQACCVGSLCQNDHRCLGATCSCAQGIEGSFVIRTGGTLAQANGSNPIDMVEAGVRLTQVTEATNLHSISCARRSDQTVWCWNDDTDGNNSGGLGQGDTVNYPVRRALQVKMDPDAGAGAHLTNVRALSNGVSCYLGATVCAIRDDDTVWCWGNGDLGILQGVTAQSYPRRILIPSAADGGVDGGPLSPTQINIGRRHACFLANGDVYCWGSNVYGTLGRGTPPTTPTLPLKVVGLPAGQVTKITTGAEHTCALIANGQMYCWGVNNSGQIGAGPPVINGCSTSCEQTAKRVETSAGVPLAGVVDVQAAYQGTCATRAGGELYCWGDGVTSYAQPLTIDDAGVTGVVDMTYCGTGGVVSALLNNGGELGLGAITCP